MSGGTKAETKADFAARLNRLMDLAGMTIYRLAIDSGCQWGQVRDYTTGEVMPDINTLQKLAVALGVPLAALLPGSPTTGIDRAVMKKAASS